MKFINLCHNREVKCLKCDVWPEMRFLQQSCLRTDELYLLETHERRLSRLHFKFREPLVHLLHNSLVVLQNNIAVLHPIRMTPPDLLIILAVHFLHEMFLPQRLHCFKVAHCLLLLQNILLLRDSHKNLHHLIPTDRCKTGKVSSS